MKIYWDLPDALELSVKALVYYKPVYNGTTDYNETELIYIITYTMLSETRTTTKNVLEFTSDLRRILSDQLHART